MQRWQAASNKRRRMPIRRLVALLVAGWLGGTLGISADEGKAAAAVKSVDNFAHAEGTVTAPLGKLGHFEKRGRGPVHLLLLPGASYGWRVWEDFMQRNAERYTMWAITPAGYDGTPPPPMPEPYDIAQRVWSDALVASLVRLIDEQKMDRPIVVGHHLMGDYYALRLGLEHADRVRAVVVLAGEPTRDGGWLSEATYTPEQKVKVVEQQLVPFLRSVTLPRWLEGTYKASALSRDPARGKALFQQQISTPLPTQIRYFLEFLSSSLPHRLEQLKTPLLVVEQRGYTRLDQYLEENREQLEKKRPLDESKKMILELFGSEEKALDGANGGLAWRKVPLPPGVLELHYVEDSGIFVMDDQPAWLDQLLADWIGRVVAPEG